MPAHRARMRMRPFLRDRRRLHQLGIDMPIDLGKRVHDPVRIILRDDGNWFLFALRGFVAVMRNRPCRFACAWFLDWSHRLYHKRSRRILGDRLHRLFRDHLCRLFRDLLARFLRDCLCRFLCDHRHRFLRDHLHNILFGLLPGTRKMQFWRGQRLRVRGYAGNDEKRGSCQC